MDQASQNPCERQFAVDLDWVCLPEFSHPACPSTIDHPLDCEKGSEYGSSADSNSGHLDGTECIVSHDGVSEITRQTEATTVDDDGDDGDVEEGPTSNPKLACDKQDEDIPSPNQMRTGKENIAPAFDLNRHAFGDGDVVDEPPGFPKTRPDKEQHAIKLEQSLGPGRHYHQPGTSYEPPRRGSVKVTIPQPNEDPITNWVFASWTSPDESTSEARKVIRRAEELEKLPDPTGGSHLQDVNTLLNGTKSISAYVSSMVSMRNLITVIDDLTAAMTACSISSMDEMNTVARFMTTEDKTPPLEADWQAFRSPSSATRQTRMNESKGMIHRLMPLGRTIHFDVDTDSFSRAGVSSNVTKHITHAAREVARGFRARNLGISFDYAPGPGPKVFSIRYDPGLANDTLAESFFPCDPRERWRVRLSPIATLPRCFGGGLDYIHNILAHEFTHILGFRHWNAGSDAREVRESSVLWPGTVDEDRNTIMNTGAHVGTLCFSGEDFRVIGEFYSAANGAVVRDGRVIVDVDPYDGRYVL